MTTVGYARVSSLGQRLGRCSSRSSQGCDKVFKEKRSGSMLDGRR